MDRQRIDKWLWHARVVRTRNAAAALAEGGLVRVNGVRIDAASRPVRTGDVVTIALDRVQVLKVAGFSERRGAATDAAMLFQNLQPKIETPPEAVRPAQEGGGRPDRRERREILRLKRPRNA